MRRIDEGNKFELALAMTVLVGLGAKTLAASAVDS
jgi:hypothetical protein